ncbi:MAG TPA: MtrB/PioB family decaheme-associated outer membrane protein [Rhodocyclaceae bacterium]|nr:MtrB/PioB family decaheme-associated outer membrane protein [Rhodocyclaceae bacterium]
MQSNNRKDILNLPLKALCLAVAAACAGSVWAEEDDEVQRLIKPESSFTLGAGHVSGDNQRFGMYNGLSKEGTYGIGSFSVIKRDDDTGTWFRAQGRNLGLSNAELRAEHERQGAWRYFVEFDQTTRNTPYTVFSNVQGVGTNNLTLAQTPPAANRATAQLPDFKVERLGSKLGFSHYFNPELEFTVLFQNVEKKGERLFGRGSASASGSAQEFLAEPINSITRQLDVVLNYTGDKLQLAGGYYGSWYLNANNQLNVNGGDVQLRNSQLPFPSLPFSIIALPPDNFSHQLHLAGGYQFTDKTRGNFKVAYSHAGQMDSFPAVPAANSGSGTPTGGLNASGRNDLGGRVDTTLLQGGITSRLTKELSVLANLRYEDRDDNTSLAQYIRPANASTNGYNEPRSLKNLSGKVEATYRLPMGFRVTGGVDGEQKQRSVEGVRVVGYREQTDEVSSRLEVGRSISETINGSVAYIHSERTGSAYRTLQTWNALTNNFNPGLSYSNRVQPIFMADRNRDKVRVFADWNPAESLNLQFAVEQSQDKYGAGRDILDIGPRAGDARLYSVDATWTVTDNWKVNGWYTRTDTRMKQASGNNTATMPYYTAALGNYVDSIGVGVRGKVTGSIDVGADAMVSSDLSRYTLGANANSSIPDIKYDQTTLKFFGRYAVNKDTKVRLDYLFDQRKIKDWTWNGTGTAGANGLPYIYTDGTWLYQNPQDKVHFIGVSVNYAFR